MAERAGKKSDKPASYEVGFGKPPKRTRFKPGRSGNPKGRPKDPSTIDVAAIIETALAERVQKGQTGQPVTRAEAMWRDQIDRAIQGETRVIRRIVDRAEKLDLLPKLQLKGFIEIHEPEGETGDLIRAYAALKRNGRLKFDTGGGHGS